MMKYLVTIVLSSLLFVVSVPTNSAGALRVAQKFRSGIAGRLTDPNGAVVAGATIRMVARSTNAAVIRKSDDRGEYVADLDPDAYDVEADAAGFKKVKRKSIPVLREARSYVDFVLEPKARFDAGHP
jgi:Carboxypeptidase regulatory-like domain